MKKAKKQSSQKKQTLCKSKCERLSKIEGWCTVCYAKFKKGFYTSDGSISPEILKKRREAEEKKERLKKRKQQLNLEKLKDSLKSKLTSKHLNILTEQSESFKESKYCEKLQFWTNDSICYSRLFVIQNKKCAKCKVHDKSIESLHNLLENINEQSSKTTTTQIQAKQSGDGESAESPPQPAKSSDEIRLELENARKRLQDLILRYKDLLLKTELAANRTVDENRERQNIFFEINDAVGRLEFLNQGEGSNTLAITCMHSLLLLKDDINDLKFQNAMLNKKVQKAMPKAESAR